MGWACSSHGRDDKCRKILLKSLSGRDHSEVLGVGGRIILKLLLRKQWCKVWVKCTRFGLQANGGVFWTWWCTFRLNKRQGITWLADSKRTISLSRKTLFYGVSYCTVVCFCVQLTLLQIHIAFSLRSMSRTFLTVAMFVSDDSKTICHTR
jgi:hypothetical protein